MISLRIVLIRLSWCLRRGRHAGVGLFFGLVVGAVASPVEFSFRVPNPGPEPFARDVWAWVAAPDGTERAVPAFYDGDDVWRVRVAARRSGSFRLLRVEERMDVEKGTSGGTTVSALAMTALGPDRVDYAGAPAPPVVRVDPRDPRSLVRGSEPYLPFGLNLAWGDDAFYARTLPEAGRVGVNWTRIWMAPWAGLNLSWLPPERGPSPRPGALDLEVARRWDRILDWAGQAGIGVQVVVFSHGQLSTQVNPVWADHPWNVDRGGFLTSPSDFFTSPDARRHTRTKLRYLAARYGHSPAVLAWELFNEVNFTDAWKRYGLEDRIAMWHDEMAAWLRRNDPEHHLVTTSLSEAPVGALWRSMDYYQPHVYPVNGLAHVRRFPLIALPADKPLFYGEIGDDHQAYDAPDDKASNAGVVPVLWCGLMVDHAFPAQTWYWQRLVGLPRWPEFAAVAGFVRDQRLASRWWSLRAFDPVVETAGRTPQVLGAGFHWALRGPAVVEVPNDGREPVDFADVPEYIVGSARLVAEGRTDRLTLRITRAQPGTLEFRLVDVGPEGATVEWQRSGDSTHVRTWESQAKGPDRALRPATLRLPVPAGPSEVHLRNRGPDAIRLREVDLDQTGPVLSAVGKRDDRFLMVYLWHRTGVHTARIVPPEHGTLVIPDLPAGTWRVTWWAMEHGGPSEVRSLRHPGGEARIPTPPISRHAALALERD